ncbi:hypothetical protein [Streptomyces sp. AK04-3B]|nr:hypothetical protein [Streptomyces sp. AK04-3B]MDX3798352.1 hypothetical protein [Streptomyces sp. AK04-3B]
MKKGKERYALHALFDTDSTSAAPAVESDNDPATGGGAWPGVD